MSNSLSKVGIGAGLVSRDTEDTNLFSVATNVPGNQEVRKGFKPYLIFVIFFYTGKIFGE